MINAIVGPLVTNVTAWPNQTNAATNHRNQLTAQFEVLRASTDTELQKLNSVTDGSSGADQIKMTPIASTGTANTVQSVTEALDGITVKTTGDQTITGVKTFSASPRIPSIATNDAAAINKEFFDLVAVKNTGDQTIEDIKTFSSSPIVPTPTTGLQVANKNYVDEMGIPFAQTASSGNTSLAVTISGITEYTNGLGICIEYMGVSSSGNGKINLNSLGEKTVKYADLDDGELHQYNEHLRIITIRFSTALDCWLIQ